jgi:DinB superfamily
MNKQISTAQTDSNIKEVLRLLSETPVQLERLSEGLADPQLRAPLGRGERSFVEVLAHLSNSEARSSETIYLALLVNEPLVVNVHPERQWGKLLHFDRMPFDELLAYFKFRRTVLMSVLDPLSDKRWARSVRGKGKQRKESVYWRARAMALHELEHLSDLEDKVSRQH